MGYTSQTSCLFHVSNLSIQNFRSFLLNLANRAESFRGSAGRAAGRLTGSAGRHPWTGRVTRRAVTGARRPPATA